MKSLVLIIALAAGLFAQSAGNIIVGGAAWLNGALQNVPNAATDLTTKTAMVDLITLTNTTAGAVTVTIKDRSTNCNGAACNFLAAKSIAANDTVVLYLPGGVKFTSGINWQASAANSITTSVRGKLMP